MKKSPLTLAFFFSVVLAQLAWSMPLAPMETGKVVDGNTEFALKMYQRLRAEKGNIFFSPYSVSSALGMTYAGARGDTATQMRDALSFPGDMEELCRSFGNLQDELNTIQKEGDIKLSIANAIWAEKTYTFLPEFLNLAREEYKAKLEQADFVNNFEAERQKINAWIERKTNDKIKNMIPKGILDSLTRMVLVNAIYFKGDWASQFDKKHTRKRDFYVNPDKTVKAEMMYQKGKFRLAQDADTQALEMPYKGDKLSMLVLLPKQKEGIDKLQKSLTGEKLKKLIGSLRETTVQVSLPKFKTETFYDLIPPFKNLGMTDAFDKKADFSGMDGSKFLYIGAILHKAFVEVDEKGTEAAAATVVVMKGKSARRYPRFTADHPFLFLIRDTTTGSILFMGRIMNPIAESTEAKSASDNNSVKDVQDAVEATKSHLDAFISMDLETLKKSYAARIQLMPGHEYLKDSYGVADPGARVRGAVVDRSKLLAAIGKAAVDRPPRPAQQERVLELLKTLTYTSLTGKDGKLVTDPTDPIGSPDGKLRFTIKPGDIVLKAAPPKGDFLLLQLRPQEGAWQVVAEYID